MEMSEEIAVSLEPAVDQNGECFFFDEFLLIFLRTFFLFISHFHLLRNDGVFLFSDVFVSVFWEFR